MGGLPKDRVRMSRPFNKCAVDYGGPIYIKEDNNKSKRRTKVYIAVFVCMCTKAIHIELVTDLTTQAFLFNGATQKN